MKRRKERLGNVVRDELIYFCSFWALQLSFIEELICIGS